MKITATLERIRYQGRGYWSVAELRTTNGKMMAVGPLVFCQEGDTLELEGEWMEDKQWGRQFKFQKALAVAARDDEGLIAYLHSTCPGVGRTRAADIVARFGAANVFQILENEAERLLEVPGITQRMARDIREAVLETAAKRDTMVFLKRWRLTDYQCGRVLDHFGVEVREVLERNPYQLTEVAGLGFLTVDKLALANGIPRDSLERARAAVLHLLDDARGEGHVFLTVGRVKARAGRELRVPMGAAGKAVDSLEADGKVVREEAAVYLPGLWEAERAVARRVLELAEVAA
jgi:exodeoxyribonuclease V alpha subunit